MTEKQQYIKFMYNKENIRKCEVCPENRKFDSGASGNRRPCGQFNCWVAVHCYPERY